MTKLHLSKDWLFAKLYKENLSIEEIAKLAGVSPATIYRAKQKHGLK